MAKDYQKIQRQVCEQLNHREQRLMVPFCGSILSFFKNQQAFKIYIGTRNQQILKVVCSKTSYSAVSKVVGEEENKARRIKLFSQFVQSLATLILEYTKFTPAEKFLLHNRLQWCYTCPNGEHLPKEVIWGDNDPDTRIAEFLGRPPTVNLLDEESGYEADASKETSRDESHEVSQIAIQPSPARVGLHSGSSSLNSPAPANLPDETSPLNPNSDTEEKQGCRCVIL